MTAPYDHEALWIKAKLFLNRAMDDEDARAFDERALWASLALELLAKAALARVTPALIADPSEDGINLLIASGLVEGDPRFLSVRAKTIFSRCQRAFKPFNAKEAEIFTSARNEYLHSSGIGFATIPPRAWWPRYWSLVIVLIAALEKELEELVGADRQQEVEDHLAQNTKNIEHRTETLIERAKLRLAQFRGGTLPAKVAAEFRPGFDRTAGLRYREPETCPACGEMGTLEGDEVSNTEIEYEQVDDYDFVPTVTLTIESEFFSCPTCQLVLDSYELINQAGLSDSFYTEGDEHDVREPDYGND
ncbi:hypothetical protein OG555_25045 [Kribbella sp. NBC_01484]|uniref:hypothetical protein n=1 Tax=Kribbella sp. NBC_01484 TaxID=2903579 RepID=UPI002E329A89|nr:hypothetical protein [Kribbella sp. NBC_01484]